MSAPEVVEIGEPPCTCRKHRRVGEKSNPWIEVEYNLDCTYHFPQAAN